MADLLDQLPVFPNEGEEQILDRVSSWANEGLDPATADPDQWTDVREGSFAHLPLAALARESARWWDRANVFVAVAVPQTSYGQWLDLHAEARGLERLSPTVATGVVAFTGTSGTVVPAGTTVSATATSAEEEEPPRFVTAGEVTLVGGAASVLVRAQEAGTSGNLAAGALTTFDVPVDGVDTVTNPDPTVGGTDAETDEALVNKILTAGRERGGANQSRYKSRVLSTAGVGSVYIVPLAFGDGTVLVVPLTADRNAVSADVVAAVQNDLDPAESTTTLTSPVTLPTATIPVQSTAGFPDEGYVAIGDQLVRYLGRTLNSFTSASGGTGSYASGTTVLTRGRGGGWAPVGHHVQVTTAQPALIAVTLGVDLDPGQSLSAVSDKVRGALAGYLDTIGPGQEIVLASMIREVMRIRGIHDVSIASPTTNLTLATNPPRAATLGAFTLTETS